MGKRTIPVRFIVVIVYATLWPNHISEYLCETVISVLSWWLHLAQLTNTSVVAIKLRYGPHLDKNTAVPFMSNNKIDRIFAKLRGKYETQKQVFLEARHIEEVNSPNKLFIILLIVVFLVPIFFFIKWNYL